MKSMKKGEIAWGMAKVTEDTRKGFGTKWFEAKCDCGQICKYEIKKPNYPLVQGCPHLRGFDMYYGFKSMIYLIGFEKIPQKITSKPKSAKKNEMMKWMTVDQQGQYHFPEVKK